jgi:hypothetical protein
MMHSKKRLRLASLLRGICDDAASAPDWLNEFENDAA